jgi:membrane fusion protein (multidrug efflux system)
MKHPGSNPSKILTWSGCALLLLLGASCGSGKGAAPEKSAKDAKKPMGQATVDAIVAKVSRSPVEVSGAGTLLPMDDIDLKSEATGRIASLNIREGRQVEAGALLAKIDDALLQAQKAKALSQVHRFGTLAERKKQELSLKAVSQQEVDLAQADLEAAQADLALVEAQIRNTEVRAPFAGRLGLRDVSVGQFVSTGQTLVHITRVRPLRVELSVPEVLAGSLREGAALTFRVLGRLDRFTARVDAVEPRLDEATRTLKVRASYSGATDLLPGASVTILLDEGSRAGIFVPPEALSGDAHGAILFLGKGGIAKSVRPVLGTREADKVEILSGVEAGDTVLVVGASNLAAGKSFKIANIAPSP